MKPYNGVRSRVFNSSKARIFLKSPAISLPLAESAAGLPVGMMLSAVRGQEARLLELAYELEEARPWPRINA